MSWLHVPWPICSQTSSARPPPAGLCLRPCLAKAAWGLGPSCAIRRYRYRVRPSSAGHVTALSASAVHMTTLPRRLRSAPPPFSTLFCEREGKQRWSQERPVPPLPPLPPPALTGTALVSGQRHGGAGGPAHCCQQRPDSPEGWLPARQRSSLRHRQAALSQPDPETSPATPPPLGPQQTQQQDRQRAGGSRREEVQRRGSQREMPGKWARQRRGEAKATRQTEAGGGGGGAEGAAQGRD